MSFLRLSETEDEFHRARLSETEDEFHRASMATFENMKQRSLERLSETKNEFHRVRIAKEKMHKELNSFRERLSETEDEFHRVRLSETEDEFHRARNILKQQEREWESVNQQYCSHTTKTETHSELHYASSTIQQIETHYISANQRSELKQEDEEVNFFKQRLQESVHVGSSPQRWNPQGREHQEIMTQMEAFYKEKLKKARFETAKKEKELKSLKDSLAAQVAASLKTGDTESMNNPVSKTRLTEMYDNLKLLQWPKVKNQLKSRKMNPKEAKDLIQKTFGNASDEMKRRRQQIKEMFQQAKSSSGPTQKVKEYRQLTVQNLQMALFHTNKEELLKTGYPECLDEFPEEVKVDLRPLTSECYWLSCLMALNNPPLQPDWKNHVPGFDSWDIFPREIKHLSCRKKKKMQQ